MTSNAGSETRHIVIIGGGIIGCTTAYYLATHPSYARNNTKITLVEASRHGPAQGASGKAGGLVAKWAYPRELVDVSFAEHVRLAEAHGGAARWGWRFVGCGNWQGHGERLDDGGAPGADAGQGSGRKSLEKTLGLDGGWKKTRKQLGLPDDLNWVKEELTMAYSPMAKHGETAQVHPYQFTTSMLELAQERGVEYVQGKVTTINIAKSPRVVTGVTYVSADAPEEPKTIPATTVVLAAGVWSPKLVPDLPIEGTRAHSITIRPRADTTISPYVLFTEITLPAPGARNRTSVEEASPEIYARPDNEVYCCGPGDSSPVPDTVDDVRVDERACDRIREHVASISRELREGAVERRQACFLPVVRTSGGGGPIVGEAKSIAGGVVIATGHTCWVSTFVREIAAYD
jgi:glycine/D-amino acid oxidase-like deaminating enzyme